MNRRLLWWLASLGGLAAATAVGVWAPSGDGPVLCIFRRALALPCPGCGMTRALGHLANGDFTAAMALHPLAPLIAAELAAGWGFLGLVAHGYARRPRRSRIDIWLMATGLLLLAVWMGRLAIGDLSAAHP